MGFDLGRVFPFGDHVDANGNLKPGGKGLDQYLWPFGDNVDANGNIKPRGAKPGGYASPGGNPDGSGQDQAQQRPGIGPYQGHTKPKPQDVSPTVPTRDVQKANGAKGTQTSPGGGMPTLTAATVAQFLQDKRIGLGAFSSIQLPGTPTNPITGVNIAAEPFSGQEPSITTNTLGAYSNNGVNVAALDPSVFTTEMPASLTSQFSQFGGMALSNGADTFAPSSTAQGGKGYTEIKPNDPMFAKAFGQDLADKQTKGNTSRLNAALNDTAGMQSYMSKFGSPEQDKRRAADMAFLNTSGSQEGLRAKEAVFGQAHFGGQTYQLNDARTELLQGDNGKPLAMDPKAASSYRLGTSTAEDYKNSYKGKVKEIMPTTPKQAEAPSAQNPVEVTEMPTNTNFGPIIDDEAYARNTESLKGMTGVGPVINGEAYGAFLEGNREPLMRDPRK